MPNVKLWLPVDCTAGTELVRVTINAEIPEVDPTDGLAVMQAIADAIDASTDFGTVSGEVTTVTTASQIIS